MFIFSLLLRHASIYHKLINQNLCSHNPVDTHTFRHRSYLMRHHWIKHAICRLAKRAQEQFESTHKINIQIWSTNSRALSADSHEIDIIIFRWVIFFSSSSLCFIGAIIIGLESIWMKLKEARGVYKIDYQNNS